MRNQQLAGAQNPEAAAKAAAQPVQQQEEVQKQHEEAEQSRLSKLLEINDAINMGFTPSLPGFSAEKPKTTDAWKTFLEAQDSSVIDQIHEELVQHANEQIDQQTDAAAQQRLNELIGTPPEHPQYDPLADRARRECIEKNLDPIDLSDMVFHGFVTQRVPLGNGITLTLRSLSTLHGQWIEWYVGQLQQRDSGVTIGYVSRMLGIYQLAAALDCINDRAIGPELTPFYEEDQRDLFIRALEDRARAIGRMPQELTNDFIVQNVWFSGRIRKLLAGNLMERVGNS